MSEPLENKDICCLYSYLEALEAYANEVNYRHMKPVIMKLIEEKSERERNGRRNQGPDNTDN